MLLPPLKAVGKVRIEIYGTLSSAKWDEAVWGQSTWAVFDWLDVTPQGIAARITWGADDPTGVLTIPAAGSWVINTYDPQRLMDPANGRSAYASSIRPGKPIRVSYINAASQRKVVRQGLIDEVDYDIAEKRGTLRGTDMVQLMVNANLPAAQVGVPMTLRARAAHLINKAGLAALVPVEPSLDSEEKVVNGSFESGLSGWGTPAGGNIYTQQTSPDPPPGQGANYLVINGNGVIAYPQIASGFIPVVPGEQYIFGCWARNEGTSTRALASRIDRDGGATLANLVWGPALARPAPKVPQTRAAMPNSVWSYQEVAFTIPAGATSIYNLTFIDAVPPNNQYACFDGITIRKVITDPPVGPAIATEASVWTHILTASLDALYAPWLDRNGILRFRSFGNPNDAGFQAGGADGIPISTLKTQGSLQGVYTRVIAFDDGAPTVPVEATDATKRSIYGDITLKREQPVPDATVWSNSVLADRSGASLQYTPGTLYPQTEGDLENILDLGMIDIAHLVVESTVPTVDVAARVLGGTIIADTGTGFTAELVTYIPATEWEEAEQPEPPVQPIPPGTVSGVVRTYACTKDARLAHSGSLDAGNGQDTNIPIGYVNPYRNRAVLGFASIPFAGVVRVDKAELLITVGANSCGAFGSDPKVQVSRLTGSFSEGSYDVNCGFSTGNAVKYPGPAITSSGAVTSTVPKTTGSAKAIDITGIVRAWMGGQPQHGLMIKSAGEDTNKYTTAIYARHHGTSGNRPSLRLTLTIEA